ncbi:MAG: hypothetical protein JWR84_1009 [Caulobacter sp.]|nr:hypothetical protein [Caulobacter sp.]
MTRGNATPCGAKSQRSVFDQRSGPTVLDSPSGARAGHGPWPSGQGPPPLSLSDLHGLHTCRRPASRPGFGRLWAASTPPPLGKVACPCFRAVASRPGEGGFQDLLRGVGSKDRRVDCRGTRGERPGRLPSQPANRRLRVAKAAENPHPVLAQSPDASAQSRNLDHLRRGLGRHSGPSTAGDPSVIGGAVRHPRPPTREAVCQPTARSDPGDVGTLE